jgi:hypothetical protein
MASGDSTLIAKYQLIMDNISNTQMMNNALGDFFTYIWTYIANPS